MDANDLRALCLALPGAVEDFPFGPDASVFKVAGKMFALSALESAPLRVNLKCEPDLATELRANYRAIQPGYHMSKRHWNTVTLDGSIPDGMIHDLVEDSYELVVQGLPASQRARLGRDPRVAERR